MTPSPLLVKSPRELFIYTQGYGAGYDYGVEVVLKGSTSEPDSEVANVVPPADLRADPPARKRALSPDGERVPGGSTSGDPQSSPTDREPDSDSEVRVVGHYEKLGVVLASHRQPAPGWVPVGTMSDDDFAELPTLNKMSLGADFQTNTSGETFRCSTDCELCDESDEGPTSGFEGWGTTPEGDDLDEPASHKDYLDLGYLMGLALAADLAGQAGHPSLAEKINNIATDKKPA